VAEEAVALVVVAGFCAHAVAKVADTASAAIDTAKNCGLRFMKWLFRLGSPRAVPVWEARWAASASTMGGSARCRFRGLGVGGEPAGGPRLPGEFTRQTDGNPSAPRSQCCLRASKSLAFGRFSHGRRQRRGLFLQGAIE
jgi:hypothetical protein